MLKASYVEMGVSFKGLITLIAPFFVLLLE